MSQAHPLSDRFETTDGSRPSVHALPDPVAKKIPLSAFRVLDGGDVVDVVRSGPDQKAESLANQLIDERIMLHAHGTGDAIMARVRDDLAKQLRGNAGLSSRLFLAKPVAIDVLPPGESFVAHGFPRAVSPQVSGLYWDRPEWDEARIALRRDHLEGDRSLVFHEMAHAIHYLAFTQGEREVIYGQLRPTFGSPSAMDEAFAIYSERELAGEYDEHGKKAPGVYGFTRRQWSEDHVFTRFVRKLYHPQKGASGPKMFSAKPGDWMRGLGRS